MTSSISTQSITTALRQSVLQMQTQLAAAETEMSTGNYADIGLTLGARTGESISLQSQQSFLETITNTNRIASTRLSTTQNILSSLQNSAQSLLNSLVEANGSSSNSSAVQALAETNLQSLISSLNTSVGGEYIFAGTNISNPPISNYYEPGSASKAAVDAAFQGTFGFPQTSSSVSDISATDMQSFLNTQFATLFQGPSWSNWSSATNQTLSSQISEGQTVATSVSANNTAFQQLAQAYTMIADLGTQNLNASAYAAITSTAQGLLNSAISNLTDIQASVGVTQSTISSATNQISLEMNILSSQVDNLQSVNPYEVSVRVTNLQTQIETSYSLTAQLQHLSLVTYL